MLIPASGHSEMADPETLFVRRFSATSPNTHRRRILWLHGYTLDGSIWETLLSGLPEMDHLAPDLPGHGKSRPFCIDDTLDALAQSVLELADREAATDICH